MTSSRIECAIRLKAKGSYPVGHLPGAPPLPAGRVPRLSRLLALAHKFDGLLRQGIIADYAALARLGHVSRARITQIMNLLGLAPDIQEAILFLPPTWRGRDPIHLRHLQALTRVLDWSQQRALWAKHIAASRAALHHIADFGGQLPEPLPYLKFELPSFPPPAPERQCQD